MSIPGAESGSGREQIRSRWQRLSDKVSKDAQSGERLRGFVVERLSTDVTTMIRRPEWGQELLENPWFGFRYDPSNRPDVHSLAYFAFDYTLANIRGIQEDLATKILIIAEEYETIQRQAGSSPA